MFLVQRQVLVETEHVLDTLDALDLRHPHAIRAVRFASTRSCSPWTEGRKSRDTVTTVHLGSDRRVRRPIECRTMRATAKDGCEPMAGN